MENNNSPRELAKIVENSMREFRSGMEHREQMSIRQIAKPMKMFPFQ